MQARVLPYGERAVLVEPPDPGGVAAVVRAADAGMFRGVGEAVPGAASVLLIGTGSRLEPADVADVVARLAGLLEAPQAADPAEPDLEIPLRYDGPDLERVAAHAGCSVAEVVARHSGASYRVAVTGFGPGFGYLTGLPQELWCPRLTTPRPRVPAGSVALAARWTGVYPRAMPGGWNILGTTAVVTFDPARRPPALLHAGRAVRFVARP
jgi:KipI family sensor histidine kinase inhibitor